jgi:hypothetical protein
MAARMDTSAGAGISPPARLAIGAQRSWPMSLRLPRRNANEPPRVDVAFLRSPRLPRFLAGSLMGIPCRGKDGLTIESDQYQEVFHFRFLSSQAALRFSYLPPRIALGERPCDCSGPAMFGYQFLYSRTGNARRQFGTVCGMSRYRAQECDCENCSLQHLAIPWM